jgi:hypothetical protein
MSWEQFLQMNPEVREKYEEAIEVEGKIGVPDPMDEFYYWLVGKPGYESYDGYAPEYGERAWRIIGSKYSLIVWDEGNGWTHPLGVEIEVEKFRFVKKR